MLICKDIVRKSFLDISGIRVISSDEEMKIFECVMANSRDFHIRMRRNEDSKYGVSWNLELAVKKYFDRWANSVNFVQEIPLIINGDIVIDFNKAICQARKIVKSKAFDWNSYFYPIMLDAGFEFVSELGTRVKV